jgi:hypothetical protein
MLAGREDMRAFNPERGRPPTFLVDDSHHQRGGGLGDNRQMAYDKKKAERYFNWQALKEAVERMKPELGAASEATHKHGADDTPNDSDLDRTVALGYLVESLEGLCGPHLWVLNEISSALYEMHAADGEEGEETPRRHTH